jgi:manganese/zinc/iron transport system substrate-binding protein
VNITKNHATALVLGLLLTSIMGCGNSADSHIHDAGAKSSQVFAGEYPILVVCTTGQVAEMVVRVGGEHVKVETMMGPGVDPHLFRPVNSDVENLRQANAIFYNGLHLEGRMSDLFVKMARRKATFAVTEGLQERKDKRLREPPEFEGMYDPHVWHDVALWSECVRDVAENLATYDPPNAETYRKNMEAYVSELAELHQFCTDEIAKIPAERRVLVTAHDAFGYFGNAYGLEVFGLKGVSTEEEKDLAHQETIQKMIIERKIPAVFVESAVAPRTIEALVEPCQDAGHDLKIGGELFADALGAAETEESTYTGMIRHNVRTIVKALSE